MNGIIGFASLLNEPHLSETQKSQFLEIISKSSQQLLKTINDLLDISLIETGSLRMYENKINLNNFLNDIYLSWKPKIKEGISFSLQKGFQDNQSYIYTDEEKVRHTINNLLNNAIKFTEEGHIKFGYTLVKNELEFFIEDTGIGINPNFQYKIFEHFLKAELETSRLYEGVGLGLAISKGYIDFLHGKIWVNSEIHKGSVFYFKIPYKQATEKKKSVSDIKAVKNKYMKLTILVVEDDQTNYVYIKQIFSGSGSTVYHALNGKEAVEFCRKDNDINLILMDIKMPVMNGLEATKMIREIRPDIPIIAQTAFAQAEEREMALNAGCNEYISKPFTKEQIISLIESLKQ
jgi:CheY-like chemotaxis protein